VTQAKGLQNLLGESLHDPKIVAETHGQLGGAGDWENRCASRTATVNGGLSCLHRTHTTLSMSTHAAPSAPPQSTPPRPRLLTLDVDCRNSIALPTPGRFDLDARVDHRHLRARERRSNITSYGCGCPMRKTLPLTSLGRRRARGWPLRTRASRSGSESMPCGRLLITNPVRLPPRVRAGTGQG
jgi:hypothetical protein